MNEKKGSMTVEAALVLPLFIFAMVLFGYLGKIAQYQDEIQWAMTRVVREASAEYGMGQNEVLKSKAYYLAKLYMYLDIDGISLSLRNSKFMEENDEIDLVVDYRIKVPFSFLLKNTYSFQQRVRSRGFVGVEQRGAEQTEEIWVYIATTGRVYHRQEDCTYLKLSISQMKYEDMEELRNVSGGKYYACEKCAKGKEISKETEVWITNYGDSYHIMKSCGGIRRTVEKISLSQVGTKTPCSKCGKEK